MKKVAWKQGSRVGVKAEVAYRFFERIREENNGNLDLDDVVHKSKPHKAPLHNEFEWDDKKCGTRYRRDQARYMQRSLVVETPKSPVRVYEPVTIEVQSAPESDEPPKTETVFKHIDDVMSNPVYRDELLRRAINDALIFKRKYHALSEMSKIIEVIDDVVSQAV